MPDLMTPLDGLPWPTERFLRQAPTWAPSGVIGTPVSGYGNGDAALSFDIGSGPASVTPKLSVFRANARGVLYERTLAPWSSGMSGAAPTPGSAAYPLNSAGTPRIDRLVLRRDAGAKLAYPFIIIGTPAATPVKPALTRVEAGTWDTPLHSWTLASNNSTTVSNVVDERTWVSPNGYTSTPPRIRVTRTARDNYGNTVFSAIPFDTLEPVYTYNPDEEFFVPKLSSAERRILLVKAGTYLMHAAAGFETVNAGNQLRLTRMPDPGNQALTETLALATVGSAGVSASVPWSGYLPAGTHIGVGFLAGTNGGRNLEDGISGYRTELLITRLSD